jgi:hypothetical protein
VGRAGNGHRIPGSGGAADPLTGWSADELVRIGRTTELQIASRRPDRGLRPFVTIWVVRSGDDIYVRSAYGHSNPWFQRALESGQGRIRAGRIERDLAFEEPGHEVDADIDAAYHAKYGPRMVGTVSPKARRSTLRLIPG